MTGSCHCGNIGFSLNTARTAAELDLRACTCDFCARLGGIYASDPDGEVAVRAGGAVTRYRFGTKTAEFWVCARCGGMPLVSCRIGNRDYGVVNVRCSDAFADLLGNARPVTFEDEATEQRLARRQRTWTPLAAP